jgi:hypothetical protein
MRLERKHKLGASVSGIRAQTALTVEGAEDGPSVRPAPLVIWCAAIDKAERATTTGNAVAISSALGAHAAVAALQLG